jgi:antitoxin YefM
MKTATVTEFRANAKELLEQVEKDQDILVLSRPKNQEGFVVLTMSYYEALEETAHLLSTQANTEHLMQSIGQHKGGKVLEKSLIESRRTSRKSNLKK